MLVLSALLISSMLAPGSATGEATLRTDDVGEGPCSAVRDHLRIRGTLHIASRLLLPRQTCSQTAYRDAPDIIVVADRIVLAGSGVVGTTSGLAGPDRTVRSDGPTRAVGGPGGDAVAVSTDDDARAVGGDGGRSGRLRIEADRVIGEPTILGGRGGDGGTALAIGAGQSSNASGDRDRRDQGENGTDYTDPNGGSAFAVSGDGGDGGDAPGRHGKGGDGGYGGQLVSATGEEGGSGPAGNGTVGNATAVIGDGGDGGSGTAEAGLGGYPGEADVMPNGSGSTVIDGEIGRNGSLLPPAETSTQESLPLGPGLAIFAVVLASLAAAYRDD